MIDNGKIARYEHFSDCILITPLSSFTPLPVSAGLGFMGRRPMKNLLPKGVACPESLKQVHFEGNLCYHAAHKTIWFKKKESFRD
jgi:hypothetical protein